MTDREPVFTCFGSRGLYCFDLDGRPRWKKDLGDMRTRAGFGEGSSPALYGDTIVVNRARSYDLRFGDLIWECGGQTGNVIPPP